MSIFVTQFNPGSTSKGSFINILPNQKGTLVLYNDSGITLQLTYKGPGGDQTRIIPAWMIDAVTLDDPAQTIYWMQLTTLSSAASAPTNTVYVVGFTQTERLPYQSFPVALQRVNNIGNYTGGGAVSQVVQTGETPPNVLVQSSPVGYTISTITIKDDGTLIIYGKDSGVNGYLFSINPGPVGAATIQLLVAAIGAAGQCVIDRVGDITTSGSLTLNGTIGAGGAFYIHIAPADGDEWIIGEGGTSSKSLNFLDNITNNTPLSLFPAGQALLGALFPATTIPTISNGMTIATGGCNISRVTNAGAVTGIIMEAGTINGQMCIVLNEGSSITMAVYTTSHVASGASCVIAANTSRLFVWDSNTSLWY